MSTKIKLARGWSSESPLFKPKMFSSNQQLILCSYSIKVISYPDLQFFSTWGVCMWCGGGGKFL